MSYVTRRTQYASAQTLDRPHVIVHANAVTNATHGQAHGFSSTATFFSNHKTGDTHENH